MSEKCQIFSEMLCFHKGNIKIRCMCVNNTHKDATVELVIKIIWYLSYDIYIYKLCFYIHVHVIQ